jgi:LysM repeat protein
MGFFDFIKDAGASVFDGDEKLDPAKGISHHLKDHGISSENLKFNYGTDSISVSGWVPSQEIREKVVTIIGNVKGIAQVEDLMRIGSPPAAAEPAEEEADSSTEETVELDVSEVDTPWESRTYTVQSGDTLGKIAREMYGDASKYTKIFEANTPMLKDPNKIYPGQVLRIPNLD